MTRVTLNSRILDYLIRVKAHFFFYMNKTENLPCEKMYYILLAYKCLNSPVESVLKLRCIHI